MSAIHFGPERPPSHPDFNIDKEIKRRQKRFTNISVLSASTVHSILSWSSRGSRKSTPSTHHTPDHHEQSKRDILREILRKWRRSLLRQHDENNPSWSSAAPIERTPTPAALQQPPDYASLIKTAISNSPSCALYADEICSELIRTSEWCRTNQDPGWQKTVALELPRNGAFEPIVETRKNRVSRQVKWKLAVADSGASASGLSWRSPRQSPSHPIELPTEQVHDLASAANTTSTPPPESHSSPSPLLSSVHGLETAFTGLSDRAAKDGRLEIIGPASATSHRNRGHTTYTGTGPASHSASPVGTPGSSNLSRGLSPTGPGGSEPPRQTRRDGSDGSGGGRKRPRLDNSDRTTSKRKLACVYRKMYPDTYDLHSQDYQACALKGWENPADLLVHLLRKHGQHSCRRCYQFFSSVEECNAHSSQCPCHLEGTRVQKWGKLWQLRFPDVPVPEDPYFDPPCAVPQSTMRPEAGISRLDQHQPPPSPQPQVPTFRFNSPSPDAPMLHPNADLEDSQPTTPSEAIQDLETRIKFLEQWLPIIEGNFQLLNEYVKRSFDSMPVHASPRQDSPGKFAASFGGTIYGPSNGALLTVPFDDAGSLSTLVSSTAPSVSSHACATKPSSQAPSNGETGVPLSAIELDPPFSDVIDTDYLNRGTDDVDYPMPDMDQEMYLYNLGPQAGSTPGFAFNRN